MDKDAPSKLPFVLLKCFEFLEKERSLRTVGLFRLSGNKNEIEKFKRVFESPSAQSIDFPNSIDPNIVTGIVKSFLREMPEPLLTYEHFGTLSEIGEDLDEAHRMKQLKSIVHQLPVTHFELLRQLIEYLVRLVMYSDRNRLSSSSLAVVFGPLIMRAPSSAAHDTSTDATDSSVGGGGGGGGSSIENALSKRRGLSQRIKNIYINTIGDMIENYTFIFENSRMNDADSDSDSSDDEEDARKKKNGATMNSNSKFHLNLSKLVKNDASGSTTDTGAPDGSSSLTTSSGKTIVVGQDRSNDSSSSQQVQPTARTVDLQNALFTQLKMSASNKTSTLKHVGVKKPDGTLMTPRNMATGVGGGGMVIGNEAESLHKIILDLEEKLKVEQRNVERLKEERESLNRESMKKRKELNEELDTHHEQYKLLKNEWDRAKSRWELQEEEYQSQIKRLEDENARLKKESLALKLGGGGGGDSALLGGGSGGGGDRSSARYNIHGSAAEEDKILARKSMGTGQVQVSNRFQRASRRLTDDMMKQLASKGTDSDSSDDSSSDSDDDDSGRGSGGMPDRRKRDEEEEKRRKRFSTVRGQQPNLFADDTSSSGSRTPTKKKEKKDYFALCGGCKLGINHGDSYVQAKGVNYHTSCFVCNGCKCSISGAFAERDGHFYCKECLDKMRADVKLEKKADVPPPTSSSSDDACGRCGRQVSGKDKVRALKRQFHKDCFKCFQCNCEFVDNKFYSLDGDPVCLECKKASLKK